MQKNGFAGLTVLDLSEAISGPYCTKRLGGFGANVIKIESPEVGDAARQMGPFPDNSEDPETSATFLYLNTNKKSITLNLEVPEGIQILKQLVQRADVLVENAAAGSLSESGIGYTSLAGINPRLIMASITDFGRTGPYRDYKGGRIVNNALGGYSFLNGDPEREPLTGGGDQPAYQGGCYAYNAIMAALLMRHRTGRGQAIDISVHECMAAIHQFTVNRFVYTGRIQKRTGNRTDYSHPTTLYACRDGFVSISINLDEQLLDLLVMMEMDRLLSDERFQSVYDCYKHADAFDEAIAPWFLERTRAEVVETCQDWRIPAASLNSMEDILQNPHYEARGFWKRIDHPVAGPLPYARGSFHLSRLNVQTERAPLLGEHNQEVYTNRLGFSQEELAQLKRDGVI